ncbi:phosphomannomutase/phosphoglucomutase, partial [Patescibacteria group bacterium]|nr:phosphomannomutase/phosphoglucomutase [Patescibacteria group bacterium]
ITPEIAEAIGKAYGSRIRKRGGKNVIIGHEIRPHGEELKMQFIQGVLSTGCNVFDAGVSLTPIIYFSTAYHKFDGGVNVTGSHNVYFFNGFKTMAKNVYPVYGKELQKMRRMVEKNKFIKDEKGGYVKIDVSRDYKSYLLKHNQLKRKLKVVLDCGNGSAGVFAPEILRDLGCDVVEMYTKPDAHFPNHVPDPEDPWVMQELSKRVVKEKADIGIGLDADGDRCGVVDEKGEFIYADRMLLVLAKKILVRNKGGKVLYDVKCTRLLEELIPRYGGKPLMHCTGHAPIKQSMRDDKKIIFGGEISGHFFWAEEYFKIDDGVYSAAKILTMLSESKKPFSYFFKDIPLTPMTPELKLPCGDKVKVKVVKKITKYFKKRYKTITIDGVRVVFSDKNWALVRASNTSPYLTIRVEAETDEELIKIKNIVADQLEKYPEIEDKLDRKNVTSHTGKLGWV